MYILTRPKWPAAARNLIPLSPFPFPPKGQAGAGGYPPTPEARRAPAKSAGTHRCCRLPPQEGCRPLVHPPLARTRYIQRPNRDGPRKENLKDGRHVVLDFYDLLIEPIMPNMRIKNYLVNEREMLGEVVLEAASNAKESTKTGGEAGPQSARPRTIEVCRSQTALRQIHVERTHMPVSV